MDQKDSQHYSTGVRGGAGKSLPDQEGNKLQRPNSGFIQHTSSRGTAVAQLVEALRYKSEGRGFDSRWCHWNFSLT